MELNQVTASSADLERAEQFYRALGLILIVKSADYLRFECPSGGSTFSLDRREPSSPDHAVTVYFECADLDDAYERLVSAGVAFDEPPQDKPWLWREARLRDPDGNRLCLFRAGGNRRYPPWRLETVVGAGQHDAAADRVELRPIGRVVGGRSEAIDDHWLEVEATLELDESAFEPDATAGLADFSHVEVVYLFHLVDEGTVTTGARHPRERQDWPEVGIFAQRARMRPNRIGVSVCRLLSVDGLRLRVQGLDAIDGTPVLDLKPYMAEFAPIGPVHQPPWSSELMEHYWS